MERTPDQDKPDDERDERIEHREPHEVDENVGDPEQSDVSDHENSDDSERGSERRDDAEPGE